MMHVGTLTLEIRIPGCRSLKEKRSHLKPILAGLHKNFNISASEIDQNDHHQFSVLACALVSNDARHVQKLLAKIPDWIESRYPGIQIIDDHLMML
jgi:uncharacterized protein YlxP (DUF503 family)